MRFLLAAIAASRMARCSGSAHRARVDAPMARLTFGRALFAVVALLSRARVSGFRIAALCLASVAARHSGSAHRALAAAFRSSVHERFIPATRRLRFAGSAHVLAATCLLAALRRSFSFGSESASRILSTRAASSWTKYPPGRSFRSFILPSRRNETIHAVSATFAASCVLQRRSTVARGVMPCSYIADNHFAALSFLCGTLLACWRSLCLILLRVCPTYPSAGAVSRGSVSRYTIHMQFPPFSLGVI